MSENLSPKKYPSQGLSPIHMATVVSAVLPPRAATPPSPSSFFHKRYVPSAIGNDRLVDS